MRSTAMGLEAMIMLAVSVLTTVYLVYALLRPEKF
jgi:K+-transporting ATPase KdpF subunit